ncbi:MAG: hypothetical protein ABIK83_15975 [Candidatus Zixiibacteriota bacterium]
MCALQLPQSVYADTDFLVLLTAYAGGERDTSLVNCKKLHDACRKSSTAIVTSVLAYEEAVYILLYKNRMIPECKSEFVKLGNRERDFKLSQFKKHYPGQYANIYHANMHVPVGFHQFLRQWRISLRFPSYTLKEMEKSPRVAQYALVLMKKYVTLEPMDCLHISIARNLGIDTVITSDKSYQAVNSIRVIDPRSAAI